ncbi:hypothetical protein, partial [Paraburkholderia bryophila]|uniref:hypothetical protein n=1 Tax=Paraburkholderia bryophila TaxID=420952 RepID=UPI001ABF1D02
HVPGLQQKICSTCSWLHFLKSWSLHQIRGGSQARDLKEPLTCASGEGRFLGWPASGCVDVDFLTSLSTGLKFLYRSECSYFNLCDNVAYSPDV